jgi:hypothetical protein
MDHPNDMTLDQLRAERERIRRLTPADYDRMGCGEQDALADHRELVEQRLKEAGE